MNQWLLLGVNSISYGGLLFLLSAGFSLIFGLMRIPNLTHGSFFMLGAYLGASFMGRGPDMLSRISARLFAGLPPGIGFWLAALLAAAAMAAIGGLIERFLLRRLAGHAGARLDAAAPRPLPRLAGYLPGEGAVDIDRLMDHVAASLAAPSVPPGEGTAIAHGRAISSPSPRSCGERVGVRGSFHGSDSRRGPLTRRARARRPLPASGAR